MKICAISPFFSATQKEILNFISSINHDLIVLPGNASNHPTIKQIQKHINKKSHVFVEIGNGKLSSRPWIVSKNHTIQMPKQIFVQNPKASDLDLLQKAWLQRTQIISNKKVSFAICGEVDGFTKNGLVKYRRNLPFEVLINPTHTVRGRWNHLGPKLSNLSHKKVVVHTANKVAGRSLIY